MAYLDAYLQPCPGYGWSGGPEFKTRIVEMANGRERRNAEWDQPRHRFSAPFLNISREAYTQIKQMHLVCRGQLHAFRFRDELDHVADNEFFGVGDGAEDTWQLSKISTIDGISYGRNVHALLAGITVTINDVLTEAFTVDMDTGVIEFTAPPANAAVLRWSGEFDVWVRFEQDWLPFSYDSVNAINGSVDLLEVPAPQESS